MKRILLFFFTFILACSTPALGNDLHEPSDDAGSSSVGGFGAAAGIGGAAQEAEPAPQEDLEVVIRDIAYIADGVAPYSEKVREDGSTYVMYLYRYGDSCYQLMQMHAEDMAGTGLFNLVGYSTTGAASFWQMEYIGPGEFEPLGECDGGEYHVELGCASYDWDNTFISASLAPGFVFGDFYSAPEVAAEYAASPVTVRDIAEYISGLTRSKTEESDGGRSYYQYSYRYAESCYPVLDLYARQELEASGLFDVIDVDSEGVTCFWQIAYTGPGAEDMEPLGYDDGEAYHVELGCANYFDSFTGGSNTFVSLSLCPDIGLGYATWAEGYEPETDTAPDEVSGFSVEYRTVDRPCPVCHGSGSCNLCSGTGVYRIYGESVDCDPVCSFCDGIGTYEAMEYYYVPN